MRRIDATCAHRSCLVAPQNRVSMRMFARDELTAARTLPTIESDPSMKHILVVDDDALMLSLITRALPDFALTLAHDGQEALAIVGQGARIDLVITDYLMPSMMGDELVGRLREQRPDLKSLLVTGHGPILEREDPEWWNAQAHLSKPFRIDALREAVINLIGRPV